MVYINIVIAAESNASFSIIERQTSRKPAPTFLFHQCFCLPNSPF